VLSAVFFSMLLVTAMTMVQAVRERTRELAVLKTVGFSNAARHAARARGVFPAVAHRRGHRLGLAVLVVNGAGDKIREYLGAFDLPPRSLVWGLAFALLLGLLAGALPAAQALRLRIVDALRRA
jgi:putative ABC transport system permease protein